MVCGGMDNTNLINTAPAHLALTEASDGFAILAAWHPTEVGGWLEVSGFLG